MALPIFGSKIVAGVLAGSTFTLAGAGLLWAGGGTIDGAKQVLVDTKDKIFNYEQNENTLLGKLATLKKNADETIQKANGLISSKNAAIADLDTKNGALTDANGELSKNKADLEAAKKALEEEKTKLTGHNGELEASIVSLNSQLDEQIKTLESTKVELQNNKDALTKKDGEYKALESELNVKITDLKNAQTNIQNLSAKVSELTNERDALAKDKGTLTNEKAALQKENGELKETISWGTNKVKDIDKNVKGVEGEITKANKDAEDLGKKTDAFKSETKDAQPLTQDEINKVATEVTQVQDDAAQPVPQQ